MVVASVAGGDDVEPFALVGVPQRPAPLGDGRQ